MVVPPRSGKKAAPHRSERANDQHESGRRTVLTRLSEYGERFEHIRMERVDGILQVTLHTAGDSLLWCSRAHEDLPVAFEAIARDPDNRVVILTGAGQDFCG